MLCQSTSAKKKSMHSWSREIWISFLMTMQYRPVVPQTHRTSESCVRIGQARWFTLGKKSLNCGNLDSKIGSHSQAKIKSIKPVCVSYGHSYLLLVNLLTRNRPTSDFVLITDVKLCKCSKLKQNEAQSARSESTHKNRGCTSGGVDVPFILHACQVRVTVGDSGPSCICVTDFER